MSKLSGWIVKLAVGLLAVAALGVGAAWLSAALSHDRDFAHTRATAALPLFDPSASDGLVRIQARGGEFRARVAGLGNSGPALLLLHGFPETSAMWQPLLERAAADGFRVAAFDQRGYSPGIRPPASGAYALPELRDDALAVADALGFARFHLVGHDWGSIVGWNLTSTAPERVLTWTSLSIPHPGALLATNDPDAGPPLYIRVFRIPGAAETLLSLGGMLGLRTMYGPDIPPEQLAEYVAVFSEPGALTAALDWYRGNEQLGLSQTGAIDQPVLYVWGRYDLPLFVNPEVREAMPPFVTGPYRGVELDASHWLMHEAPGPVVDAVMAHLTQWR